MASNFCKGMEGVIVSYRQGRHTQTDNQMVINLGLAKEEAEKLVGKVVVWKNTVGKEIKGKISGTHGNKGAVRALFEKGLPGQCLAGKVEIK